MDTNRLVPGIDGANCGLCRKRDAADGGNGTCPHPVFVREARAKLELHDCSAFDATRVRHKRDRRPIVPDEALF